VFLQNIKQKNIEGKFSKLYVPNNKNEKDQVEVSPENYVERAYLTVIPISEESSTQSVKEQYFETFSVKNEVRFKTSRIKLIFYFSLQTNPTYIVY
jgi:hypothetical protein